MSQVVITRDSYAEAREKARRQEKAIDVERAVTRWRRTDPFEPKILWAVALAAGVAAIVAMGSLVLACSMFGFGVTLLLARLFFRRR